MEKVASHINEMQKIYEDYGCVFDQLAAEQSGADKQVNNQPGERLEEPSDLLDGVTPSRLSTGHRDLDGGVPGPLAGGLVEPSAVSATAEEGASAHAVRLVQTRLIAV